MQFIAISTYYSLNAWTRVRDAIMFTSGITSTVICTATKSLTFVASDHYRYKRRDFVKNSKYVKTRCEFIFARDFYLIQIYESCF